MRCWEFFISYKEISFITFITLYPTPLLALGNLFVPFGDLCVLDAGWTDYNNSILFGGDILRKLRAYWHVFHRIFLFITHCPTPLLAPGDLFVPSGVLCVLDAGWTDYNNSILFGGDILRKLRAYVTNWHVFCPVGRLSGSHRVLRNVHIFRKRRIPGNNFPFFTTFTHHIHTIRRRGRSDQVHPV